MTTRDTLESMLDSISRLETKDEASITALFPEAKEVTVTLGKRGIGLSHGKMVSICTSADGNVNSGALNFGTIAPVVSTFVLGARVAPVAPVAAPVVEPGVVVVEGDLPTRRKRGEAKGEAPAA
jgi:hypothetical protein